MKSIRLRAFKLEQTLRSAVFARVMMVILFIAILAKITTSTRLVCILDGDSKTYVSTMLETEEELLARYDIDVGSHDRVSFSKFSASYIELEIARVFEVKVRTDGEVLRTHVYDETVSEVLKTLDITLSGDDQINLPLLAQVQPTEEIIVDRITYKTAIDTQIIPRQVEERESTVIADGSTRIIESGHDGMEEVELLERFKNGQLESTEVISSSVTKKPKSEVRLLGVTKPASDSPVDLSPLKYKTITEAKNGEASVSDKPANASSGAPDDYLYILESQVATAYTAKPGARTATGAPAAVGYVAVNPKVIPYGTRLYIETEDGQFIYGHAVAADTGGALMSGAANVDLYFNTLEECIVFGRRKVTIYVLP